MPTATARTFSDQLRDLIRECGRSVPQLARDADIDHGQIHRFLSGDRGLTTASLDKIGAALGLKLVEGRPTGRRPGPAAAGRRGKGAGA